MSNQHDGFLPDDYEVPETAGLYMKFQTGANVFRILTTPILGYENWTVPPPSEKPKPVRWRMDGKRPDIALKEKKSKHFWAMLVWNYQVGAVQLLEITQKTVIKEIKEMVGDKDWGDPRNYDISVTRHGESLDTEYFIQPKPHKDLPEDAAKAVDLFMADHDIALERMFDGGDPVVEREGGAEDEGLPASAMDGDDDIPI